MWAGPPVGGTLDDRKEEKFSVSEGLSLLKSRSSPRRRKQMITWRIDRVQREMRTIQVIDELAHLEASLRLRVLLSCIAVSTLGW